MLTSFYRPASRKAFKYICPSCKKKLSSLSSFSQQSPLNQRQSRLSQPRTCLQQRRWIGRNYIKKMVMAEDDFSKRAEDIRSGRKRSVLEVLEERGFVNQIAGNRDALKTLFDNRRVGAYVGIDPTASSMHVGHMVPFMALAWLYVHGYSVYFLLGGATAGIGDPEGRLSAREKVGRKERRANIASMHMQLKRFGETMEKYASNRGYQKEWAWRRSLVNNSAWQNSTAVSEWLRMVGSGVRLGPMLGRDSVKNRLEKGDGMSFAEFCYPLVQAWDWWELFQKGVQVQIGGADQFGNILQGAEAVKYAASVDTPHQDQLAQERKISDFDQYGDPKDRSSLRYQDRTVLKAPKITEDPLGFTVPLLTTASGEKFGKSAGNAIWLDPDLTPPFDLYQFFLRSADADVEQYLKLFTFLSLHDITTVMTEHNANASKRVAQHKLALEFVELIHGKVAAETAEQQHRQLFNKRITIGEIQSQSKDRVPSQKRFDPMGVELPDSHPSLNKYAPPQDIHSHASNTCTLPASLVYQQPLSRILWSAGLVATKSEGNRLISNGGVYIGGKADGKQQMGDELSYTPADTKKARWEELERYIVKGTGDEAGDDLLILRTGKWRVKIVRVVSDEVFRERGLSAPGWGEGDDGEKVEERRAWERRGYIAGQRKQQETRWEGRREVESRM